MKTCWRAIRYYMVKIGGGVMAPSGVIYDLEKKHRVTMVQRITKNKIIKMNKKSTTKWEQQKEPKQTGTKNKNIFIIENILKSPSYLNIIFVFKENVSNFLKLEHDLGISLLEDYLGEAQDRFHKFNPF